MSRHLSTSPAASQPAMLDSLVESMIDLSEYDNVPYQSPSLSPSLNKATFTRPTVKTETINTSLLSTNQQLSGPSHQYDLYKQQTGIVPGALASTLAVNQSSQVQGYGSFSNFDYMAVGNTDELFDFSAAQSQLSLGSPDMDLEFDSPSADPTFFFDTVNPNSIGGQEPGSMSSPPAPNPINTGVRVWPGMHQQAAMAKAQQQQQQRSPSQQPKQQPQRNKSAQPSDPIVEQKITQLLNSMRAKSASSEGSPSAPSHMPRQRKDEEDMDDDERLLASEEGKKLTSKERRQLRNKVSARAFRSRRKEYITQLEAEIANKVTENGELRAENRALADENKRLGDLTRMLLSSPSFSTFLNDLSANPQSIAPPQPQQTVQPQQQQQQQQRQLPKDINPYSNQSTMPNQQIGFAMMPESNLDYSMLTMDPIVDGFTYQPQVYTVLETPQPTIDFSMLSGKTTNFVGEQFDSDDEKSEMPVIERAPAAVVEKAQDAVSAPVDEDFENDPMFALYHDSPAAELATPVEIDTEALSDVDIFGGIEPEKAFARYELVDATEEKAEAARSMARVDRICSSLDSLTERLESLMSSLQ